MILDPLIRRNIDPSNEGVRVTTTARRLIATMEQWAIQHESDHFFIAPVTYEKPDHFRQSLVNQLSRPEGPNHFRSPDARADSLLVKRSMFQDEREVRILCVGTGQLHEGDKIRAMPILPNHLFTEVRFDPRLTAFERREREETLRKLGYEGTFVDDGSYVPVLTLVPLPNGWPSPE
ncbi:hypothetical protein ABENE_07910 [Asticcacaulis benevestitus DSM 16100 = ATCC BAA-896]|uniref:Uncharacterized protein n=1 Tax=Asticcacaulis benevestitus DSM 16100 = ATCC BAA-896 TaxID=1121022 RepID=V4RMS5_9CAUL|nr:hypothetical protein ABENE_07910 [Asticcacaulis benevestitus DSM 16100 = ATCC BAA-896]